MGAMLDVRRRSRKLTGKPLLEVLTRIERAECKGVELLISIPRRLVAAIRAVIVGSNL